MTFVKGQERTPTSGRKKGTPNKGAADIKAALAKHGPELRKSLLKLCRSENEQVRLSAIKEAMDRLYGKARQPLGGEEPGTPLEVIHRVVVEDQPIPLGPVEVVDEGNAAPTLPHNGSHNLSDPKA